MSCNLCRTYLISDAPVQTLEQATGRQRMLVWMRAWLKGIRRVAGKAPKRGQNTGPSLASWARLRPFFTTPLSLSSRCSCLGTAAQGRRSCPSLGDGRRLIFLLPDHNSMLLRMLPGLGKVVLEDAWDIPGKKSRCSHEVKSSLMISVAINCSCRAGRHRLLKMQDMQCLECTAARSRLACS